MFACDRHDPTAAALAGDRRILSGSTLLLGLTLALRRP
jgi:hypothetical protein